MKNLFRKPTTRSILLPAVTALFLCACTTNRIFTVNDIVYSSKRFELKYTVKDKDRRSPLIFFTQSIVKENNPGKEISYTAYDVLDMTNSSFKVDEKVFFIIDNEAFPMAVKRIELENTRNISENITSVSTSDSTSVSVVTGYSENNRKTTRFIYQIAPGVMNRIRTSGQFMIRYYSGPDMITVKPKNKSLQKIKQLAEKN